MIVSSKEATATLIFRKAFKQQFVLSHRSTHCKMFYIDILDSNWQRKLILTSHFQYPFLLRQYESDGEPNPWLNVNNCAYQDFSHCHNFFSSTLSRTLTNVMS